MKKLVIISLFIFFVASCNNNSNNEQKEKKEITNESEVISETKIFWHWEDDFSPAEKTKIKKYISAVTKATFNVLGEFPFDVHYYFERSNSKTEPIPWAHTERGKKQAVRFFINPKLDSAILYSDWTAPHEISHLSIPYVGKENSWFAEGYASYMQYQIMQELGIYTKERVVEKYQEKIENIRGDYSDKLTFTENAKVLRNRYNFPAMYWGGAKYFMHINKLLEKEGTNLNALIKNYQECCRNKDKSIGMLLNSLDKDFKKPIFANLFNECSLKSFSEIFKEE